VQKIIVQRKLKLYLNVSEVSVPFKGN